MDARGEIRMCGRFVVGEVVISRRILYGFGFHEMLESTRKADSIFGKAQLILLALPNQCQS